MTRLHRQRSVPQAKHQQLHATKDGERENLMMMTTPRRMRGEKAAVTGEEVGAAVEAAAVGDLAEGMMSRGAKAVDTAEDPATGAAVVTMTGPAATEEKAAMTG